MIFFSEDGEVAEVEVLLTFPVEAFPPKAILALCCSSGSSLIFCHCSYFFLKSGVKLVFFAVNLLI